MASYPATLPDVMVSGLGYQPQSAVVRTQMEDGRYRIRRRFRSVPTEYSVSWTFTTAELEEFESWFQNTIDYGADEFTITMASGNGNTTVTAQFIEEWSVRALSIGLYQVSTKLQVLDRPVS